LQSIYSNKDIREHINYSRLYFWGGTISFLIFPFWTILGNAILFSKIKNKKLGIRVLIIMISLFLALVNSTKQLESDLLVYSEIFDSVKDQNLLTFLILAGKEQLYAFFTYLTYHLTFGNFSAHIFLLTAISYTLYLNSIRRICEKFHLLPLVMASSILFASFFPQLFSLSAHINRQFFATSLILYILSIVISRGVRRRIYALLGPLIHSTVVVISPFLFFKKLGIRINGKSILKFSVLSISFLLFKEPIYFFFKNSIGNNPITYILERATTLNQNLSPLSYTSLFFIVLFTFLVVWLFRLGGKESSQNLGSINKIHAVSFLIVFIILTNFNNSEVANRFLFMIYFLIPYYISFFLQATKNFMTLHGLFLTFIMILFWTNLEFGVWSYFPTFKLLFTGFISVLFK
jgi:hypothetical protein